MRKGSDETMLVFLLMVLPISLLVMSGGFNITRIFSITTQNMTTDINPSDCQSYKSQIDSMQNQIDQLNSDLSNSRNSSSGFSVIELVFGFIIGAGVVIGYFLWHEKMEKDEKAFTKSIKRRKI